MDESGLIAAARLGDEEAFAKLYRQYIAYIRGVGRNILRSNDVDDVCQETFMLAFTRLNSFEGNSQFRTWLTQIAINQCRIILRKGQQASNGDCHLVQLDATQAAENVLDRCLFASNDAHLEGVAARLDLEKMLRVLKPSRRQVLEMAYLEGVPDLEIAEALGISLTAVKTRLYQAKQKIRQFHPKR